MDSRGVMEFNTDIQGYTPFNSIEWIRGGDELSRGSETVPLAFNSIEWILLVDPSWWGVSLA